MADFNRKKIETRLKKLAQKDKSLVVHFAARCSLRAFAFLGGYSIAKIWQKDYPKHFYAILRVNILFASNQYIHHIKAATTSAYSATVAAFSAFSAASATTSAYSATVAAFSAFSTASAARSQFFSDGEKDILDAFNQLIDQDLNDLEQGKTLGALWQGDVETEMNRLLDELYKDLNQLELGFFIDDIKALYKGNLSEDRYKLYLKEYSDAELNAEDLRAIFSGEETKQNQAVRIVLLGPGGAGKTSLSNLMIGKKNKNHTVATTSVVRTPLKKLFKGESIEGELWDFGGQAIFRGLHQSFLYENCVYILVVDSRHQQSCEHWLHQIYSIAGAKAQVLVATNIYENCNDSQNEKGLKRKFPNLFKDKNAEQFFYFNCFDPKMDEKSEKQYQKFISQLIGCAKESQHMVLEQTIKTINQIKKEFEDEKIVKAEQIKKYFGTSVDENKKNINKLKTLGTIITLDDHEEEFCMDANWASEHCYELIHSLTQSNQNEMWHHKDKIIEQMKLKNQTNTAELLKLLVYRGLAFTKAGGHYCIVDATPSNEPDWDEKTFGVYGNNTFLLLRLDYCPYHLNSELVKRIINQYGKELDWNIWREGFVVSKDADTVRVDYDIQRAEVKIYFNQSKQLDASADFEITIYSLLNNFLKSGEIYQRVGFDLLFFENGQPLSSIKDATDNPLTRQTRTTIKEMIDKNNKENTYIQNISIQNSKDFSLNQKGDINIDKSINIIEKIITEHPQYREQLNEVKEALNDESKAANLSEKSKKILNYLTSSAFKVAKVVAVSFILKMLMSS